MSTKLKPKLFSTMKTYTKEQLIKDIIAGIIVAIIALPLSIALALASGVTPEQGIYTAIVAGFIISFLGGSRVQIAGPTAAFATIVAGIVLDEDKGMNGLIIATIIAGIILIVMGLCRLGSLIRYIPYTITTGFTSGIAVTILVGQLKDFFGVKYGSNVDFTPISVGEKIKALFASFDSFNYMALLIGLLALAILIIWPKINKIIPPSLIAVIVTAVLVKVLDLNVSTIGSSFEISSSLPTFNVPTVTFDSVRNVLPDAFTIAILAAIESLLSAVVADGMIGSKHNSNMELVAQGTGNIFSGLFGGIPATGAIARTAANVKNGGRTPVAGMIHAVTLLLILVVLMPYASMIPMPAIAAILFMVAYNMSEWREFSEIVRFSPKSDICVLITTFVLTVVFDLVIAIGVGIVLAAILFMKRMADVTNVKGWTYIDDLKDDDNDPEHIRFRKVPKNTRVFEIAGPMFFGATDKLQGLIMNTDEDVLIIRMRNVPAMDASALNTLNKIVKICKKNNVKLIFSHVNEQPMSVMKKAKFDELVGTDCFAINIDEALKMAENA